jgi:hypothetical protein
MSSHELRSSGIVRAITKSDTVDIPRVDGMEHRAIWVGTAGTLTFLDATGRTVTNFPAVQGLNQIKPVRILNSGTATDLWALY